MSRLTDAMEDYADTSALGLGVVMALPCIVVIAVTLAPLWLIGRAAERIQDARLRAKWKREDEARRTVASP